MTATLQEPRLNPFNDPATKPQWAQLSRLGGDRVAILFEDLRRHVAKVEGIIESLRYAGPEEGWVAEYRADGVALFMARIFPGVLEVTMPFDARIFEALIGNEKLSARLKSALREAESRGFMRLHLDASSAVRSFANFAAAKSKMAARR